MNHLFLVFFKFLGVGSSSFMCSRDVVQHNTFSYHFCCIVLNRTLNLLTNPSFGIHSFLLSCLLLYGFGSYGSKVNASSASKNKCKGVPPLMIQVAGVKVPSSIFFFNL